ncbi:hypothetical protein AAHF65_002668 [Escherichia coli]
MIAQPQQALPHRQPVLRPPCTPQERQPGQGQQRRPSLPTVSGMSLSISGVTSSRGWQARIWRVKAWSVSQRSSWF